MEIGRLWLAIDPNIRFLFSFLFSFFALLSCSLFSCSSSEQPQQGWVVGVLAHCASDIVAKTRLSAMCTICLVFGGGLNSSKDLSLSSLSMIDISAPGQMR